METVLKNFFLALSKNQMLNQMAKKWGLRFGAHRVVAGETIDEAIVKVRELNEKGLTCTLDHLGEFVFHEQEANEAADYCIKTLEAIAAAGVDCNLSLKMTQLGLDISRDLCVSHMRRILDTASKYGNFVRIDMEDYAHNEITLEILRELRKEYDNVGTVIQAYLYKSEEDVRRLGVERINLRLVKGAYKEPEDVAFPLKKDVDDNFKKLISLHLESGSYTAVATHDDAIIEHTKELEKKLSLSRDQFEFQMLYGIRTATQLELSRQGYRMRVYVPYGNDWYGYFMRRLAERPANVAFVLKGLLRK
ncbi:proline dehydrogenase family protein [Ammoniphilus sp. CFH 90114]|uniref:proline dehydrogenase family protein n=1 Tax=Ammoniphilus sp. CFH 90114 TaxID=2493665 RepID=UPI00100FFDFC|nr:proline dehydrogenase [Ammoniphilus sp. CFH 90114]RXT04906.1 proline dehydrogenase [Ammoniphilus sp. CFH 90114]